MGDGTVDPPGGAVEGGQEAVAGRVHLPAPESVELMADHLVVPVEKLMPGSIAATNRLVRRRNDVGEENSG